MTPSSTVVFVSYNGGVGGNPSNALVSANLTDGNTVSVSRMGSNGLLDNIVVKCVRLEMLPTIFPGAQVERGVVELGTGAVGSSPMLSNDYSNAQARSHMIHYASSATSFEAPDAYLSSQFFSASQLQFARNLDGSAARIAWQAWRWDTGGAYGYSRSPGSISGSPSSLSVVTAPFLSHHTVWTSYRRSTSATANRTLWTVEPSSNNAVLLTRGQSESGRTRASTCSIGMATRPSQSLLRVKQ